MAYALDFCDAPVSCHAWSPDGTMLAICPNTPDLLIYKVNGKKTELVYTLKEHTQVISGVDWSPVHNQIVTCSHDRNAYVWTLENDVWKKQLVILKLDRAATYVRWSPDGKKFVVATGAKKFRYCAYDPNQNWWQSYSLSTVKPTSLNVDFMPDSVHIVCATTERHCRYYTIDDDDAKIIKKKNKDGSVSKKFEYCLNKWSSQGWTNCSAISPEGKWIAMSSQDSYIRFIPSEEATCEDETSKYELNINGLPLLSIAFLSEVCLVGAGFDCQPRLFWFNGEAWQDLGLIDIPEIREASGPASGGGLAAKAAMFGGKQVQKVESLHSNIILGIRTTKGAFSTCSNDGRVGIWPLAKIQEHFKDKKLW